MKELVLSETGLERWRETIVQAISDFVKETGAKGAVLGLSGGVDSALVGALAKEALGNRLEALVMPVSGVSKSEDLEHAALISAKFGITSRVIELKEAATAVKNAFPDMIKNSGEGGFHARANIAPRLRMLFNYAAANLNNLVVLGTGNKTELLLGYFTKYGDGGVDFLPIGDLYKSQVHQLAEHMQVPREVIDKPPSAGLWHGQTDEEELGESYEILDQILYHTVEEGRGADETAKIMGINVKRVQHIIGLVESGHHKRAMPEIVKLPE
ncbi:NH(3)-dependent NAD(+) synthetase [archaeon BMS3Abin16]|nr:NH(3)-dependent NAD(+) synthetase [archaeon BMS3Abin16]